MLLNEGLLCKETHKSVIRFAPPLMITKKRLIGQLKKLQKLFLQFDEETISFSTVSMGRNEKNTYGKTMTYKEIAIKIGRPKSSRAVSKRLW